MRARTLATAFFAVALLGLPTARPATAGPGTKGADAPYDAEFRHRVRAAIQKGVEHVRTKQVQDRSVMPKDSRLGKLEEGLEYEESAAVLWTLRRAGVAADDPVFAEVRRRLERKPSTIDEACLLLLALSAQSLPDGDPFAVDPTKPKTDAPPTITKEERALVDATVKYVLDRQVTNGLASGLGLGRQFEEAGGWGTDFGGLVKLEHSDIPSTYMALLALESAGRIGAKVPSKVYVAALELLGGWQAQSGAKVTLKMNQIRGADRWEWPEKAQARGFAFAGSLSDEPTGYETAAGAMGLVVCQDALQKDKAFTKDLRKQTRDGIRDAMAWIQEHFDVTKNPYTAGGKRNTGEIGSEIFEHHWLQALARLSIHSRIRFYGAHDWYQEGAQELLRTQRPDGSWQEIWWSNCYALLFLMRASLTSTAPVFTVSENDPGK